jgi:hypothetical protein
LPADFCCEGISEGTAANMTDGSPWVGA